MVLDTPCKKHLTCKSINFINMKVVVTKKATDTMMGSSFGEIKVLKKCTFVFCILENCNVCLYEP